jgi:hypothetical protein
MRIVIGLTDIGNIAATYAKAFRALGHETFTIVWSRRHFFPDSQYDLVIYQDPGKGWAHRAVRAVGMVARMIQIVRVVNADLFILFAPAVLPTHLFYPILKRLGKKIVTAFWGSDVRYWYAFQEECRARDILEQVAPFVEYARARSGASYWDKLKTIQTAEKYSDLILSQPDCAQLQRRPYMRTHVPLDLSLFQCAIPDRVAPLVVHAPSEPGAKGTDHVLATIEALWREGIRFDFERIENMPNPQLRELLTRADILVDELYALTVGGLSAEGMASGCAVLVRYDAEYSRVPPGCPAINVNKDTLKPRLRELIVNRDLRRQLAAAGRPYVEAHNDHIRIARQIIDWIKPGGIAQYDFTPTFYREFKVPTGLLEQERQQTWARRKHLFSLIVRTGATRNI